MEFHTTCANITQEEYDKLMEGRVRFSYTELCRMILEEFPKSYADLSLDLYNPFEDETYETDTHYILTCSAINYFFYK